MVSLPIVEPQAVSKGGCSSGGCGSSGGCCGSNGSEVFSLGAPAPAEVVQTDVAFSDRRINLDATPSTGTFVTTIDMDLTVECNLRCTYCFKEKWNEHMEDDVAFDTIIWLLYASGPVSDVSVNFFGGEPLLRFRLIKRLVPFAKRRAWQMNKSIHFGITTNGTLVTDEVVDFWREWGMGFHTSIDGTAEVQDQNRPTTGGRGSSRLVEQSVPKILDCRPMTMARSTVVPESAGKLVENYHYFRSLGYTSMAFVPSEPKRWTRELLNVYERQYEALADLVIEEYRNGNNVFVGGIDSAIEGIVNNERPLHACGAGRGMLLVDIHGDLWPCHRWNKASEQEWRIGSIYEQFDELVRSELDRPNQVDLLEQDCERCPANLFCGGGCPAENLEETGYVYRRHFNSCEQTRIWARAGRRVHDVLKEEANQTFLGHYYGQSANS